MAAEPPERWLNFEYEDSRQIFKQLADEVIADQDYGSPEISIPPSRLAMTKMSGCGELSLTVNQKSAQASTVT